MNRMLYQMKNQVVKWMRDFFEDERGDTNFISILIVLAIVIALVVIFQGQVQSIIDMVRTRVIDFTSGGITIQ